MTIFADIATALDAIDGFANARSTDATGAVQYTIQIAGMDYTDAAAYAPMYEVKLRTSAKGNWSDVQSTLQSAIASALTALVPFKQSYASVKCRTDNTDAIARIEFYSNHGHLPLRF